MNLTALMQLEITRKAASELFWIALLGRLNFWSMGRSARWVVEAVVYEDRSPTGHRAFSGRRLWTARYALNQPCRAVNLGSDSRVPRSFPHVRPRISR